MKETSHVKFRTSEQHIDIKQDRSSRLKRNMDDMTVLKEFCESRYLLHVNSLSKLDGRLKNIATGMIAPDHVNVKVADCQNSILSKMSGTSLLNFTFQKVMQAVQIPTVAVSSVGKTSLALDPELLFQRLITVCSDEDVEDAFKHELAHYPMSLFTEEGARF